MPADPDVLNCRRTQLTKYLVTCTLLLPQFLLEQLARAQSAIDDTNLNLLLTGPQLTRKLELPYTLSTGVISQPFD